VRKTLILGTAFGLIAAVGLATPAMADSKKDATLYVLHAIPNTTVDVWVDSVLTLDNFEPGTLTDALSLPAGTYNVSITGPDASNDDDAILEKDVTLKSGKNYTAVAHLDYEGDPAVTAYKNNLGSYGDGGRLTVRHDAYAPDVDILAGGTPVIENLSNPEEKSLKLAAGTVSAAVALAGETAPVIGPADVTIEAGKTTIVYAWGSAADGTLGLAVQTLAP